MTTEQQPDATPGDPHAALRRSIYALLIVIAVGHMSGRILAVNSENYARLSQSRINQRLDQFRAQQEASGADEATIADRMDRKRAELEEKLGMERPFLSANDRSRWLTVRSLVEEGTYEVDNFFREPRWDSIDMVSHLGRDGERHYYSSKPPLLATMLAPKYWLITKITGWNLGTHPYEVGRLMLLLTNVPAMIVLFVVIAALAEQLGTTDWGRIFVVATACFATLLTTFAATLNNHIIGATSAAVAIYFFVQIARRPEPRGWHFLACGLAAAFTAANELPAAAFLALLGVILLVHDWKRTLIWGVPGVLLVAAAFFTTNYIAHDSLRIPYMHRSDDDPADDWYTYSYEKDGRIIQSYWQNRQGIDIGEPDPGVYALHVLIGHHGVYSLTPVWLLTLVGMGIWAAKGRIEREMALMAFVLTLTCFVFFIVLRDQDDRNYGGMTSGFRWMFWLAPFWLAVLLPAVDWMSRKRWARGVALVLLCLSLVSVSYPTWNPWQQPWIYNAMEHFGLL
ncbi:hypothetical protein [Aeoliella sp.]|uniref:hypothetical protein n=1 Tax=Aeoliella sp. TaxID=2795800 RepID=UPI003CCC2785